jgi:hypothetical protein
MQATPYARLHWQTKQGTMSARLNCDHTSEGNLNRQSWVYLPLSEASGGALQRVVLASWEDDRRSRARAASLCEGAERAAGADCAAALAGVGAGSDEGRSRSIRLMYLWCSWMASWQRMWCTLKSQLKQPRDVSS